MRKLSETDALEFAAAVRSRSESKLSAKDLTKLNKPLFADYLLHVKKFAGLNQSQEFPKAKIQVSETSYPIQCSASYYSNAKNDLFSLKEIVDLMETRRKEAKKVEK